MKKSLQLNWLNFSFLMLTFLLGLFGIGQLIFSPVHWATLWEAFVFFIITGLAITAGYHRLFSHRSYKAVVAIRIFFLLFGAAAFEGSVLEWATDHRKHHRYTDDIVKDPYSIRKGFWYAHIGWLFYLDPQSRDFSNIKDLLADRWVVFQHKYYTLWAVLFGLALPAAIAALWSDAWGGFIIAGALRIAVVHHATFFINSLCHCLGKRPYNHAISARDNWLSAWLTFGEGYHNYHHQFPLDYRNGVRCYQFDPTKWVIFSLSFLGLASELRRVPRYKTIEFLVDAQHDKSCKAGISEALLLPLRDSIQAVVMRLKEFERLYAVSGSVEVRRKMKRAKQELNSLFLAWKHLLQVHRLLQL
eukprot:TRINITY_DN16592_c0_g1_i1.p1 TRINITY_DN16592_c0_g1~~TRINITY_DN16592_c0_g1_i1.p1  ORF type:complete len:359 (+),score=-75.18 TRINITY_DN16592_c0_g1_i1:43-1119(+)